MDELRRIDDLPLAASAQADHSIPVMRAGVTEGVTVAQISTFVIASVTDGAPATLDTLNELAAALSDDPNFATTITAALAAKADASTTNINGLTAKAAPVDADVMRIADSAASFGFKKLTFANLKAWIRSWLPLSQVYTSADQTITAGGLLSLAHGLGKKPETVALKLKCTTAERGYAIGDEIEIGEGFTDTAAVSRGASVYTQASDASTTLYVRYGSNANTFNVFDKGTGTITNINNGNWRLIVKAFA